MFPKVLESEEGMSDERLRPIEKHATGGGRNDVSGIHVQVPEGGGDACLVENREGGPDSGGERAKLFARERRGRNFRLAFHRFAHGSKKRLHKIRQNPCTQITSAGIEKVQTPAE